MTRDQLVIKIRESLLDKYFKEVKEIVRPGDENGYKLLGFILGCMLIDYFSGFYYGMTKNLMREGKSSDAFKVYVIKYLPRYNPDHLWRDIRSALIHNYSLHTIGDNYGFTHLEKDGKHFEKKEHENGKVYTILNLEDFFLDIENVAKSYLKDLSEDQDGEYWQKAIRRYDDIGLIGYIKPKK